MNPESTRCGYVALLGRPNVGKSTLLNRLVGQKISITAGKPQTTRQNVLGIKTEGEHQIVYVDTPGLHRNAQQAMNRYMNRSASTTLGYVHVAVMLVEALRWTEEDAHVLERLAEFGGPVILAVTKVDRVQDKARLLPFLAEVGARREFAAVVPISATRATNLEALEAAIIGALPAGEFMFDEDQVTTASQRFLAAELVREKLIRALRDELPYSLTVEIEQFQTAPNGLLRIAAVIWVERKGHKAIIIGERGEGLKEIGRQAREEMETIFERRVFLQTWVKVRAGWADDERALRSLGFGADQG